MFATVSRVKMDVDFKGDLYRRYVLVEIPGKQGPHFLDKHEPIFEDVVEGQTLSIKDIFDNKVYGASHTVLNLS